MESLRNQIIAVNNKVDALYQMVEQLSNQMTDVLTETKRTPDSSDDSSAWRVNDGRYYYKGISRIDSTLAHKDVLADSSFVDTSSGNREKEIAPEIQVQRLTAQLTAAYNRIAALEEQLLAQRVH